MCWTCVVDEYEEAGLPVPDWEETIRALHRLGAIRASYPAVGVDLGSSSPLPHG